MDESVISDTALPQVPMELPEALREPTRSKNLFFMVLFTMACMVIGVSNITIVPILLPEQIATLMHGNQASIFSLMLGLSSLIGVLTNPVVGMFSDRTTSRLGRRRPWYIIGGVFSVIDILLMAHAPSLLVVAIEWIVLQVPINMVYVTLSAIIPDQVPLRQRAIFSALVGGPGVLLGGLFGQILVAQFFKGISVAYTSLAVTIAIMVALFLLVLREVPLSKEHVPQLRTRHALAMLKPLASRDFALVWVSRCLMYLSYTTIINFMFFFLQDAVHYTGVFPQQTTAQGVSTLFGVSVAAIIIASLVGGIISDRLLRRKLFVIVASLIMVVGLLLYAFFPIWSIVLVGTTVVGIGFGVYLAADLALASQVLSAAVDRGKDVGIIQTAIYVSMILSPIIAGITLSISHSFLPLYVLLAVGVLVSAILIVLVKGVR